MKQNLELKRCKRVAKAMTEVRQPGDNNKVARVSYVVHETQKVSR